MLLQIAQLSYTGQWPVSWNLHTWPWTDSNSFFSVWSGHVICDGMLKASMWCNMVSGATGVQISWTEMAVVSTQCLLAHHSLWRVSTSNSPLGEICDLWCSSELSTDRFLCVSSSWVTWTSGWCSENWSACLVPGKWSPVPPLLPPPERPARERGKDWEPELWEEAARGEISMDMSNIPKLKKKKKTHFVRLISFTCVHMAFYGHGASDHALSCVRAVCNACCGSHSRRAGDQPSCEPGGLQRDTQGGWVNLMTVSRADSETDGVAGYKDKHVSSPRPLIWLISNHGFTRMGKFTEIHTCDLRWQRL